MFHIRPFGNHFNLLFSVILLSLCLSFLLIQDFAQLQPSNILDDDILMSNMWEVCQFTSQFDLLWVLDSLAFFDKGNVTVIPWAITVQQGPAFAIFNNHITVQQDVRFYCIFLFVFQTEIMGHVITHRTLGAEGKGQSVTLLHCLQEMPEDNAANTCYTGKLDCQDELELLVPDRSKVETAMHTESTFFGVIQLL
uniref:TNF family profile domain-containing protein n=1 Tax=Electrophorus electricus TaxID=8005 RepID=A0A4W4DXI1_ELEEL